MTGSLISRGRSLRSLKTFYPAEKLRLYPRTLMRLKK